MIRLWWCLVAFAGIAWGDIGALVQQLGSEEVLTRNQAQEALEVRGKERPRETILLLAEEYRGATDLEVQFRLEVLLSALAREWMFYVPPGFLGINFQMVHLGDDDMGVEVLQVLAGGAAEAAGFRSGDVLLDIGGVDVGDLGNQDTFVTHISTLRSGTSVDIRVRRNNQEFTLPLLVGFRSLEQIDMARFVQEEERKIQAWLRSLRGENPQDPRRPVGHFQVPSK